MSDEFEVPWIIRVIISYFTLIGTWQIWALIIEKSKQLQWAYKLHKNKELVILGCYYFFTMPDNYFSLI